MGKYNAAIRLIIPSEYLEKLVKENPNDADLGKKIRTLILNTKS